MTDPFYDKIVERLRGSLDGNTFERCAVDLLNAEYATLASVEGGKDRGFDGAIASLGGRFRFICTTQEDVAANVRKSISHLQPIEPRRVVVATSRTVTPTLQHKIAQELRDNNITLVNLHDGADFARKLYRSPRWCRELLGVTGTPPALSRFPLRGRNSSECLLVGRQREQELVASHPGDLLVVGQPGSGKTCLHEQLAATGKALFVVSEDETRVADGLREFEPQIIVVDDAHLRLPLLERLRHLRTEIGSGCRIHANCWPGYAKDCCDRLNAPQDSVVSLRLLTRKQMLEVIQNLGVHGPDQLLHILLDQANGKPGLAVALVEAARRGEIDAVWSGESLADVVLRHGPASHRERAILAAFALGGASGMSLSAVSTGLRIPEVDIRETVAALAAGGVIEELDPCHLAVAPEALAAVLVKQVFFGGATSISPGSLLDAARTPAHAARVLMAARQRGGNVPLEWIEPRLAAWDTQSWKHFACVDEECALRVLEVHSNQIEHAAGGLLEYVPDRAIPALLDHTVRACMREPEARHRDIPGLGSWLIGDDYRNDSHLARRAILVEALSNWPIPDNHAGLTVLGAALALALRPTLRATRVRPGIGDTVSILSGLYPLDHLESIAKLWPRVRTVLSRTPVGAWKGVIDGTHSWRYPWLGLDRTKIGEESIQFARRFAATVLQDLVDLPCANQAVRLSIADLPDIEQLGLRVSVDSDFAVLFGDLDLNKPHDDAERERSEAIRVLAERLHARGMKASLDFLQGAEAEAVAFGLQRVGWDRSLTYEHLATLSDRPIHWAREMRRRGMPRAFISPFIAKGVTTDRPDAIEMLGELINSQTDAPLAIHHILVLDPVDDNLLELALGQLGVSAQVHSFSLARLPIPKSIRARLVRHPSPSVRCEAAQAEWLRHRANGEPLEFDYAWESAVIESDSGRFHSLEEVFEAKPHLVMKWLELHVFCEHPEFDAASDSLRFLKHLDGPQRKEMLSRGGPIATEAKWCDALVGDDFNLWSEWLESHPPVSHILAYLRREPNERWIRLAQTALDHGLRPEGLAQSGWSMSEVHSGAMSEYYRDLQLQYEAVLKHPDVRLHPAATNALRLISERLKRELAQEQSIAVFGLDGRNRSVRDLHG